ncbi:MAG: hypothetical protein P4L34_10360 [Paludibacter sp.]|nr:hypothetical protein [Paludibacter sp.]
MKSNDPEEDESKERLRNILDIDPDELLCTVSKFMELYQKFQLLQFPLTTDLKDSMKELFEKQYPGIKPYYQIWYVNWVFEAMEGVANMMSIRLVNFFEKVKKGENYKEEYDDYSRLVELYTKPYEARKTEIDYSQLQLSTEQLRAYEQVIEERYQKDLIGFDAMNRDRTEFLNIVYPLVLKYFADQTMTLTPDQWSHYDIIAGMGYEDYYDECKELNYYLIKKNMQEYPGLDYHHFILNEYEKWWEKLA